MLREDTRGSDGDGSLVPKSKYLPALMFLASFLFKFPFSK